MHVFLPPRKKNRQSTKYASVVSLIRHVRLHMNQFYKTLPHVNSDIYTGLWLGSNSPSSSSTSSYTLLIPFSIIYSQRLLTILVVDIYSLSQDHVWNRMVCILVFILCFGHVSYAFRKLRKLPPQMPSKLFAALALISGMECREAYDWILRTCLALRETLWIWIHQRLWIEEMWCERKP